MLLGIKWYQFVRNDDVRRLTKQPKLTAIIQSRRLTLFRHIMHMDDNADAKRIPLASPPADWRRQPGRPRITWLSSTVQQDLKPHHLTLPKQQIWLRTALCGGWCRRMALRNRKNCMPETTTTSGISEAETTNNKRLRWTFCIEAIQTQSIARPRCDSRASCYNILTRNHVPFDRRKICSTYILQNIFWHVFYYRRLFTTITELVRGCTN